MQKREIQDEHEQTRGIIPMRAEPGAKQKRSRRETPSHASVNPIMHLLEEPLP
jgi:hypothetical protein